MTGQYTKRALPGHFFIVQKHVLLRCEVRNMWHKYNPNPLGIRTGDCSVRAIAAALRMSWDDAYMLLSVEAFSRKDMPDSNAVWGACLERDGFHRHIVDAPCADCYTVRQFAADHPTGTYVLGLNGHVVTLVDSEWLDTWDSGD